MSKKLFIGRLPFEYTNEQLRTLFAGVGPVVSAVMVPDPKNGRTRGFGFVEMSSDADAQAAIAALNGTTISGKQLWVTFARERGEPPPRDSGNAPRQDPRPGRFRGGPRRDRRPHADDRPFVPPQERKPFGRGPRPAFDGPPKERKPFGRGPRPGFDGPPQERKPFGRGPRRAFDGPPQERRPFGRRGPRPEGSSGFTSSFGGAPRRDHRRPSSNPFSSQGPRQPGAPRRSNGPRPPRPFKSRGPRRDGPPRRPFHS